MWFWLGYYVGCAISMVAICCAESHGWRKSILYTLTSPVLTPAILLSIVVGSVRRRKN
jgi:hypothetical protein